MYFKLSKGQEIDLLNQPETGMGYQVVEASTARSYEREKFLILNSEVVLEIDGFEDDLLHLIFSQGIFSFNANAELITLFAMKVLSEKQFRNQVSEPKDEKEKGAIERIRIKNHGNKNCKIAR